MLSWVKVPSLDTSTDTVLLIYYGNPGASSDPGVSTVWSSNYSMVLHLGESGTGASNEYVDSSGNGNHASGGGGTASYVPTAVPAKIGYGQSGDGSDDYVATNLSISSRSTLTLSGWFYARSISSQAGLFGQNNASENGFYWTDHINAWCPGMTEECPGKGIESACTPDFSLSTWHYFALAWNGSTLSMYLDGVLKHSVPIGSTGSSTAKVNILGRVFASAGGSLDGDIDEVRAAFTGRSANWIALQYATQNDPSSFYSLGSEEAKP